MNMEIILFVMSLQGKVRDQWDVSGPVELGQQEPIWLRIIPNNRLKHLLCISIHAYVVF